MRVLSAKDIRLLYGVALVTATVTAICVASTLYLVHDISSFHERALERLTNFKVSSWLPRLSCDG